MASTALPSLQDFFPAEVFGPTRDTITVAARALANPDLVVSQILLSFVLTPTVPFSFDMPIGSLEERPASWQLAVLTTTEAGDPVRFVLVPSLTGGILYANYDGHTIRPGATLEIWSVPGQATADVTETVLTVNTYTRPNLYLVLNNSSSQAGSNTTL